MYPEFGLQTICDVFGITRQAHYKQIHRYNELAMQQAIIIKMVEAIRNDMPKIGGRKLFFLLKESMLKHEIDIGRDKFFDIISAYGFLVRRKKRRKPITTDSNHPFYKYPNLIKDMEIGYANQVWVSDITYIALIHKFAYLSLITDLYSKKIVGYCLWHNLSTEGALNALDMALGHRKKKLPIIHHSDRGLQYCCKDYTKKLGEHGIVKTKITLNNIKCGGCADTIKNGLKSLPEVSEINIDIPSSSVEVTYNDSFPLAKIKEKLSSLGYPEKV